MNKFETASLITMLVCICIILVMFAFALCTENAIFGYIILITFITFFATAITVMLEVMISVLKN